MKNEQEAKQADDSGSADLPVWDRGSMLERMMGDEDLVVNVTEVFLDDMPKQVETLTQMLDADDVPGAARLAHGIKGAAAQVGGESLRVVAFEMEKAGKAGDLDTVRARMGDLNKEFERLKKTIRETGQPLGGEPQ